MGTENIDVIWHELVSWLRASGGEVHASLQLRDSLSKAGRGIFATRAIPKREVLIRLPVKLSVNGQNLPKWYVSKQEEHYYPSVNQEKRQASPWLRCLAAYLQEVTENHVGSSRLTHYLASLPKSYETVWQWSDQEVECFLSGVHPPASHLVESSSIENPWKIDRDAIKKRYRDQIRPYLVHCGILLNEENGNTSFDENAELDQFAIACQALSTRGFCTLSQSQHTATFNPENNDQSDLYIGPFLLPIIDLLNHGNEQRVCTSLQRQDDMFIMKTERNVSEGEELLHSYEGGTPLHNNHHTQLSSGQFLLSFGFIPRERIDSCTVLRDFSVKCAFWTSPVIFSKTNDIFRSCWEVMESDFPQKLQVSMGEQVLEKEFWTLQVDHSRVADYVPEEILIASPSCALSTRDLDGVNNLDLLTDDLVTAACIPLLPRYAYSEITERSLLNRRILEDYYLGKLVGAVLLRAIEGKLAKYEPIPKDVVYSILGEDNDSTINVSYEDDISLLKALLAANCATETKEVRCQRLSYGLTLRIEEKSTLEALRLQVLALLTILDIIEVDAKASDDTERTPSKKSRKWE